MRYLDSEGRSLFMSRLRHGTCHVYGHKNANKDEVYEFMTRGRRGRPAFNAGCMINGCVPVTFEELKENNIRSRQTDTE
ncbi:MAG: hypothetical protein IJ806_09210 [Ruminococcus sp.]|nr:hypothetical protein [Ruminococcus sp.]